MKRMHFISRQTKRSRARLKKGYLFLCLVFILTSLSLALPVQPHNVEAVERTIETSVAPTDDFHHGTSSTVVFTNDQTGYAFFVDRSGLANDVCSYKKTMDGGDTWGSVVNVDPQIDCFNITVWYDRWTPGDTTGNLIHIVTIDTGADDLWYTNLNTSTDTLSTTVSVTTDITNTFNTGAGGSKPPITKGTDGDLYVGVHDDDVGGSYVKKCTATCTAGANWSTNSPSGLSENEGDQMGLYPLASAAIMLIRFTNTGDDFESKTYTDGAPGSWSGTWDLIDNDARNSTVYTNHWGVTVDKKTNDLYMTYAEGNDHPSYGDGDDDINTFKYTSVGGWAATAALYTNDSRGFTGAKIAFDENTAAVYVVYTAQATPGTGNNANVFYRKSTDGMSTWGSESAALNTTAADIYGARVNIMSNERIYVTWVDGGIDDLIGNTVVDLAPPTFEQAAYQLFTNSDSTNVGQRLAYQDTAASLVTDGAAFRLRLLLHVGGDGIRDSYQDFKLQFATRNGTCDNLFSGETYADVTGSTAIAYKNNTPADGAPLTNNDYDPTHSGHTVVKQTYEEANNFTNTSGGAASGVIAGGQDGKWDFALFDNDGATNGTYCFRVVKSDASTINTYTVIPEVTAVAVLTCNPMPEDLTRHGNYYCNDAEDKFKWAE